MSTDVASIMLPVSRALMDRERELDPMAGVHPNPGGAPAAVRGMKRGDPEPDGQTAAALMDSSGAECKRPRIDGTGGLGDVGQVRGSVGGRCKPNCSAYFNAYCYTYTWYSDGTAAEIDATAVVVFLISVSVVLTRFIHVLN